MHRKMMVDRHTNSNQAVDKLRCILVKTRDMMQGEGEQACRNFLSRQRLLGKREERFVPQLVVW